MTYMRALLWTGFPVLDGIKVALTLLAVFALIGLFGALTPSVHAW